MQRFFLDRDRCADDRFVQIAQETILGYAQCHARCLAHKWEPKKTSFDDSKLISLAHGRHRPTQAAYGRIDAKPMRAGSEAEIRGLGATAGSSLRLADSYSDTISGALYVFLALCQQPR